MRTMAGRSGIHTAVLMTVLPTLVLLLASCAGGSGGPTSTVDLAPFKKMARAGGGADTRKRLFLIGGKLVFWDRAGNCADAAYGEALYGSTPDQVLCVFHDSIAGPVKKCQDAAYQGTLETIISNLDKTDFGLGSEHTVKRVRF